MIELSIRNLLIRHWSFPVSDAIRATTRGRLRVLTGSADVVSSPLPPIVKDTKLQLATPKLLTSLKAQLAKSATAVTDAQNSYQQCVLAVSNGMSSIMAAQLPTLNTLPANWEDIETAYINARTDALSWTNQVYAELQETPEDVQSYNDTISALFADALDQTTALIADPTDATAKKLLNADLKNIQKTLNLTNIFVKATLNAITNFGKATLPDAVAQLNTEVADAYEDVAIDQAAIDEYKKEIADLQEEIVELAVSIGLDSAAIAAELVIGACFIELGPAEWFVVGLAVASTATVMALDIQKLEADQAELKVKQRELGSLEQDAAALQVMGDSYSEIAASTSLLTGDVSAIASAWQVVEDDLTAAITDVTEAISDAAFNDYQALYDDLAAAQAEWNEVYADCSLLYFNVQGNPAQLSISMSADQVSALMATEPTVDFVTYINNYPSLAAA